MKITKFFLTLALLPFLLNACSSKNSVFLDDKSCEIPCWRSITIGETTKEQVKRALEQMTDIKEDSVKEFPAFNERYDQFIYWDFTGVIEAKGEIDFQQKIAVGLSFQYDPGIPLKRIVDKLGYPDELLVNASRGDPMTYLVLYLIYTQEGICLLHDESTWASKEDTPFFDVDDEMPIKLLTFEDNQKEDSQIAGCLRGMESDIYRISEQKWNGYGKYKIGW